MSPLDVAKNRWLSFLIWQSIAAAALHLLSHLILLPSPPSLILLSFLAFQLAHLLLAAALSLLASPHPHRHASPPHLAAALLRVSLTSLLGGRASPLPPAARRRARRSLAAVLFLMICCVAGFVAVAGVCGGAVGAVEVGVRGAVFGLIYGGYYLYGRRWILRFPVIQRPLFYSFKLGISMSAKLAVKLSTLAFVCSTVLVAFLPDQFKSMRTMGKFIIQQINFYIAISVVSFSWELSHHLLQVVHTRRFIFAPPQGSAAAEANPSKVLLDAIEQSSPRSLMQYLAYLDLCMLTESNVEPWRRAVFFEETGETYRRVISVCLRPLEQFTLTLAEGLGGSPVDKSNPFAQQLNSHNNINMDPRLHEAFNDIQLCTWCARTVGTLTARSHREDRYGIAQLNGCSKAVVTTLLSCLLAVEACLGKKTNLQPANLMDPASIKWATTSTAKRAGPAILAIRKRSALHGKAYAMADILRTSLYQIVSAFHNDMLANAKAALEKTWITDSKPLYGKRDILVQKLTLFLEFRAS